jgi:predicted AAA+ superfamily ATPase
MKNYNETNNTNENDSVFPKELLSQPIQLKLAYFRDVKIGHPKLNKGFDDIWEAINSYNPGSLVLLFGPTGVGKTTIMQRIENRILDELESELLLDRERIPMVKIEVAGAGGGKFDWKDYYRTCLQFLH